MSNSDNRDKTGIPQTKEQWRNLLHGAEAGNERSLKMLEDLGIHVAPPVVIRREGMAFPNKAPNERQEQLLALAADFGMRTVEGMNALIDEAEKILLADPKNYSWEFDPEGNKAFLDEQWREAYSILATRMRRERNEGSDGLTAEEGEAKGASASEEMP